jgi:malto-oligosyltrehalose trehalohydrolase
VSHLTGDFDAQWNDDAHHVLHVMLTGEHNGYYQDYAADPTMQLARCLKDGFVYQGEPSPHRGGKLRGTPSDGLPPTAFVFFLQNHDQIGNRAFGERLTALADPRALEAAIALQLLCPQVPLLFMGEESASETPFLFFTDHNADLAKAVREGRRREFAEFFRFTDPARVAKLPDPNRTETFESSKPAASQTCAEEREQFYRRLLSLRRQVIMPRLSGARALAVSVIGPAAVLARWRMGDGAVLTLTINLASEAIPLSEQQGRLIFSSAVDAVHCAAAGQLAAYATLAYLEAA